jgi:POT family proton-dependent oligopeptide transporter
VKGHPPGLSTLFFMEMWERFSYYGMRAILILYMVAAIEKGGLGLPTERAASIYGWYTALAYAAAIPGGWIADRLLGPYRSVLLGGAVIALGQFCLALHPLPFFFSGLALIVAGTGLLKPNVSTMVGSLYEENDVRRDAGFSIFYMGINLGALISPLICGWLGQEVDWHYGFAAGGVGMSLGVAQYVLGRKRLQPGLQRLHAANPGGGSRSGSTPRVPFTAVEWKRIGAVGILFFFSALFWAAFEQAGSSLNLFADRMTANVAFGLPFPSSWYQAVNSIFIIALAPAFGWLWLRLGRFEPSSPAKFAYGLVFVGLGFLLLVPASSGLVPASSGLVPASSGLVPAAGIAAPPGRLVSPMWLVGVYLLHTIGELCLSPVGLSVVTKLAPPRIVGSMMGIWFLSLSLGNKIGGWIAGFFETLPLPRLFGAVFLTTTAAAAILALMIRPIRKMMGGIH